MNFQLIRLLSNNNRLSIRRSPIFDQNAIAKIFIFLGLGFWIIYLMAIGTALGWGAHKGNETIIFPLMVTFLMPLDFLSRFATQQTPAVQLQPYLLLPIGRNDVINYFLLSTLNSSNNYIWLALFLPYVFICGCGTAGFATAILLLLLLSVMVLINSQWYLFIRTLVNRSIFFWIVPIAVYSCIYIPMAIDFGGYLEWLDKTFDKYAVSWHALILLTVAFILIYCINQKMQIKMAHAELANSEKSNTANTARLSFLDKLGITGEYLKLEIKSTLRNKAIRQKFISGISIIIMLSCIVAYTDIYDSQFALNIWCLYCFVFFGAVNLVKVMGPEGNYIDLLMVHEENILTLLKAKYYFYCIMLLVPTLLLLPPVITGKFSILMILAYLFTTSGLEYFILFQLAVYNKQTLPLNTKITGKGNFENSLQLIVELIVFFIPVALAMTLTAIFGDTIGYTILIFAGLLFTITHNIWMRNIYKRMMKRRYANLAGFHESR